MNLQSIFQKYKYFTWAVWELVFPVTIIMLLGTHYINGEEIAFIMNDEFGYWGNAAILSGYSWDSLMSVTPYYSIGYSLLLLPIIKICNGYFSMYHAAILFNLLLICICYFCSLHILRKIAHHIPRILHSSICLASTVTEISLFQSQITWCETLLSTLMWISVFLFICLEESKQIRSLIALVIVNAAMYFTHQRTIMLLLALPALLLFIAIRDNDKRLFMMTVFTSVGTVFIYVLQKDIMHFQNSQIYGVQSGLIMNQVSVNSALINDYIKQIFDNFKEIFVSLLGKIFTALVATSFLAFLALVDYIKTIRGVTESDNSFFATKTYCVCAFLVMLVLSAVQSRGLARQDLIVYSRYMEYTFGPVILLGLVFLVTEVQRGKINYRLLFLAFLLMVISGNITSRQLLGTDFVFSCANSPSVGAIVEYCSIELESRNTVFAIRFLIVSFIAFYTIILLIINLIHNSNIRCFVALASIFILFLFMFKYNNSWTTWNREWVKEQVYDVYDLVEKDVENIYYYADENDPYCTNAKYIQLALQERKIEIIEDLSAVNTDERLAKKHYLLCSNTSSVNLTNYYLLKETGLLKLYKNY